MADDFTDALAYLMSSLKAMSTYIVFYGQQIYGEYSGSLPTMELPDGCYVRTHTSDWYIKIGGGLTPINLSDIPNEVRLNCLLMGITI